MKDDTEKSPSKHGLNSLVLLWKPSTLKIRILDYIVQSIYAFAFPQVLLP